MKRNKLRMSALLLSLALMIGLLAGCSGKENQTATEPAAETASQAETVSGTEDVSETEEAEPAAVLEDGTYTADFNTDSGMFHVNEAYDGKGTLTVADGKMVIHVSLTSKNILNLFAGLAEDAEKDFAAAEEKAKNSKKSSAAAPGVSLAFTALASAARDAGDSELAAQYCNQAIERGVSGPEIYNQLAISEMEAGDYESAMSHYEEALSLADSETALVIRQNIAVLYEKEGDFAKALEQFKECQAAGADTPEVQKEIRFLESR